MDKKRLAEVQGSLASASSLLGTIRDDEQNKFDDKSDKWRESDAGALIEEKINLMSEIADEIEGMLGKLDELLN